MMRSCAQKERFDGESRPGDWNVCTAHVFHLQDTYKLYVIRITNITARRSTIGPDGLFNLKGVNPQPESGSVAKDVMGKIQELSTTDDMSAVCCCLLWDQGL
eukprot:125090-Pelagomonas_calceolata.AAC.1